MSPSPIPAPDRGPRALRRLRAVWSYTLTASLVVAAKSGLLTALPW